MMFMKLEIAQFMLKPKYSGAITFRLNMQDLDEMDTLVQKKR